MFVLLTLSAAQFHFQVTVPCPQRTQMFKNNKCPHMEKYIYCMFICVKKQSFGIIHNYWNIKQRCTFTLALLSKKNTMKCWWLELVAIATERKELQCFTEYLKKRTYLLGVWKKYKDFSPQMCVLNSMQVKTDRTLSLKANDKAIKKEERSKHVIGQPAFSLSKI